MTNNDLQRACSRVHSLWHHRQGPTSSAHKHDQNPSHSYLGMEGVHDHEILELRLARLSTIDGTLVRGSGSGGRASLVSLAEMP